MRVRRIDSDGDWTFGAGRASYADRTESVAQRVKTRLLSLQGDWFLDLSHGLPWFDLIERPADLAKVERAVKAQILRTDGVRRITAFSMSVDPGTRAMAITTSIVDIYGIETQISTGA
ncbi:hypothetical protein SAMN02800692_1983 [Luteibacter sp. UNC138MFCol5.1]|uniref:hypothetical protein n=1 Tax=Luteibacter sp. UNC138MFCol5.1 TaxID=1502774 RepID=UPI0008C20B8C|nr:hypothetical protein [Luteibacter sp. UNC138MFCol5.1]SEO76201.1 hypothetical protein SAMN02800692_1983 [Luteibacter sp. UNC138MFCol5.1]